VVSCPPAGGQSFFSRKDSIRTIYASLYNELRKVVAAGRHAPPPGQAPCLEELLAHLAEQLCHFTQARTEMADLYEKMHALAAQKNVDSEELVAALEGVLAKYSSRCVTWAGGGAISSPGGMSNSTLWSSLYFCHAPLAHRRTRRKTLIFWAGQSQVRWERRGGLFQESKRQQDSRINILPTNSNLAKC